jgi:hypothetical protein
MNKNIKKQMKNIEKLRLPELQARFAEVVGEPTRSPNKKFLLRCIAEALEAQTASRDAGNAAPRAEQATSPGPRGRFAAMSVEELQAKYLEVVGRSTGSDDRRYLVWKIREAEKGRIPVGPRKTRARDGEPLDVKILPVRLEATLVERMDDAWRTRGIKNRMEFFRRALGHYLTHLGAEDVATLLAVDAQVPS